MAFLSLNALCHASPAQYASSTHTGVPSSLPLSEGTSTARGSQLEQKRMESPALGNTVQIEESAKKALQTLLREKDS